MRLANLYVRTAVLASLILAACGCQTAQKPVSLLPPGSAPLASARNASCYSGRRSGSSRPDRSSRKKLQLRNRAAETVPRHLPPRFRPGRRSDCPRRKGISGGIGQPSGRQDRRGQAEFRQRAQRAAEQQSRHPLRRSPAKGIRPHRRRASTNSIPAAPSPMPGRRKMPSRNPNRRPSTKPTASLLPPMPASRPRRKPRSRTRIPTCR